MNEELVDRELRALYAALLGAWNGRDANAFAALFAPDGGSIGFDGSEMFGRDAIAAGLGEIFESHMTATYVAKVRSVEPLAEGAALLRAVVGMVPPDGDDILAAVNAAQTLVASQRDGRWEIALFQNTRAAYHGRPEAVDALTEELRAAMRHR